MLPNLLTSLIEFLFLVGRSLVREAHPDAMLRRLICAPCIVLGVFIASVLLGLAVACIDLLFGSGEFGGPQPELFGKLTGVLFRLEVQLLHSFDITSHFVCSHFDYPRRVRHPSLA